MKIIYKLKFIAIALLLAVGLSACDKPGPAETAGKNIDETVDNVGDKINDAADKVGNEINDVADKVDESMSDKKK